MKRSRVVGVIGLCAVLSTGCKKELPPNVGSGVQKSELRSVPEFKKLKASGAVNVELKLGEACQAEITTDDNLLTLVKTAMRDGVMEVFTSPDIRPKVPPRVRLCAGTLEAIYAEGVSRVGATHLAASDLAIRATGAAKLRLTGSAANVRLELSTASEADLRELVVARTSATLNQAASLRLGHVETLDVTIPGPGSCTYRGK